MSFSQLPAAKKQNENGAAVTSLRSFLFCDDFNMAVPNSLRLEKEKGRELTKQEKMTTMKALVMMKTNSMKKKKIGENGEEIDEFSDEEDGQGGKRKSLKQRMKGMNLWYFVTKIVLTYCEKKWL